jgi:hypothetical protein
MAKYPVGSLDYHLEVCKDPKDDISLCAMAWCKSV